MNHNQKYTMHHVFEKGVSDYTLVLLHGTGGDEYDLLDMGKYIAPTANILSIRGNVLENGMNRYFKRIAPGVYDEEDLIFRTFELHDFLVKFAKNNLINQKKMIVLGYSNGANIATSLLLHIKNQFKGAILFHPIIPIRKFSLPLQSNLPIFIGAGKNDPLCPIEETNELITIFQKQEANVFTHWDVQGHQLSKNEIEVAKKWYQQYFS